MDDSREKAVGGKMPWKLYASRAISSWGDRMWSFAVALFMIELSSGSLMWPAIYGLTRSLSVVFLGPAIGQWVDRNQRWPAARTSLAVQNVAVVVCALCVALTFQFREELEGQGAGNRWAMAAACALIVVLGSLAQSASVASTIVVNKDWIVVLADGNQHQLARINSACRSIDLVTNIVAPIVVGQLLYFLSHVTTAVVIAAWNVLSFAVEVLLLCIIYRENPKLAVKPTEQHPEQSANVNNTSMWEAWGVYFEHDIRNAGLALACLYMTVLGFDSITTGFAYSQGVPEYVLGLLQGLGAVVGLLGSVLFPSMLARMGVHRTGLCGFGLEVICLTACVASIWAPGSPFDAQIEFNSTFHDSFTTRNASFPSGDVHVATGDITSYASIMLLMAGITAARLGLWIADLSVNQLLQGVEDGVRGTVNGVQSSMNEVMNTAKFVLVIIFPRPETFGILIAISFLAVTSGWMSFASYCYQQRRTSNGTKSQSTASNDQINR